MLKSLCLAAVCLLSHVSAFSGCNSGNVDYHDSNDNYVQRVNEVQRANDSVHTIVGGYNFKDEFTFSNIDFPDGYIGNTYYFDNTDYERCCPFNYDDGFGFLKTIQINYSSLISAAILNFSYYDVNNNDFTLNLYVYNYLSNLNEEYQTIFFNVINPIYFHDDDYALFNSIFTHDDNAYVRSYTGLFTFVNNGYLAGDGRFNIFGSTSWKDSLSYTLNFYSNNDINIDYYDRLFYDVQTSRYVVEDSFLSVSSDSPYVYFSNVKLTNEAYTSLNNSLGLFAYIPNTDTSDFHDLLFSIADTPLYFIFRLLDWRLFGMNLFIAFAGLLTLAVVLVCIRRFF